MLQGIGSFFAFFVQLFIARKITPTEFGEFNYYYGIIAFTSIFLVYGFQYSVSRQKNEKGLEGQVFNSFNLLFLAVLPIALFVFLKLRISIDICILLIIGSFSFSLLEILRIILTVKLRSSEAIFYKTWLFNLLFLILALTLYQSESTKQPILIGFVFSSFLIPLNYYVRKVKRLRFNLDFLIISFPFFLIQLFYSSHLYLTRILPNYFYSYDIIAGFSVAIIISRIVSLIGTTSSFIMMPYFSDLIKERKTVIMIDNFKIIRSLNTLVVIVFYSFIMIYAEPLLSLIGEQYERFSTALKIISSGALITIIIGPNGTIILMSNNYLKELNSGLILIITFLTSIVFLGGYDYLIFPLAFALSESLSTIYKALVVKKMFALKTDFIYYVKCLTAIAINLFVFNLISSNFYGDIPYLFLALISPILLFINAVIILRRIHKAKLIKRYL